MPIEKIMNRRAPTPLDPVCWEAALSAAKVMNRREFVRLGSVGAAALVWSAETLAATSLEAYASATSVRPGGTINFHARDPAGSLNVDRSVSFGIARIGLPDVDMMFSTVQVRNRTVPATAYASGCGWPVTTSVTIPANWPSGLYYAVFGNDANACTVPFVVAPVQKTAAAKVMVQIPVTTAQAYNGYGGKSLYTYNSSGGIAAPKVSFDRPFDDPWNYAFDPWQAPFVKWLAKNGIVADFCTSIDLHGTPGLLSGYQLFVTAGHDEYWSRDMRGRLDRFVAAGGNVAIFSGNTCWWQARMEANAAGKANRTLVCYKSATADPDTRAAYKTVNWIDLVPPDPENTSTGLGWRYGASWTNTQPRPSTPFIVQRPNHWVFAGTSMTTGTTFAGDCVGYEVDAVEMRKGSDGLVYPTFADGTLPTTTLLAWADASTWDAQAMALGQGHEKSGYGAMAIVTRGGSAGAIFNAASIEWARGLLPELNGQNPSVVSRITLNVLNKLSTAYKECVDVRRHKNVQTSGDGVRYFLTIDSAAPTGSTLDGVAFRAYPAAITGTVPIYRHRFPQKNGDGYRYYYSQNSTVSGGWVLDGVAFYVYARAAPGTVPVYKHHIVQSNGDGWRYMYSTRSSEPGWTADGISFYAPTA